MKQFDESKTSVKLHKEFDPKVLQQSTMDRSVMAIRGATRNMKYVSTLETARELLQPTPKTQEGPRNASQMKMANLFSNTLDR